MSQETLLQRPHEAPVEPDRADQQAATTIVGMAIHELDLLPSSGQWRSEVAMLTTNRQVEDRQIRVVDARDEVAAAHIKVFMKLYNWAELFDKSKDRPSADKDYAFDIVTKDDIREPGTKARWLRQGNVHVGLIYGETNLSVDGLVELRVPCGTGTPRETIAQQIDDTLRVLTGDGIWNQADGPESFLSWKTDRYRTYHKLPDGPLTPAQQAEAAALQVARTADDHYSLIAPGQHKKYESRYYPGEPVTPKHKLRLLEDAINTIVHGQLNSSLLRSERGKARLGHANRMDMNRGGGDSVYAYMEVLEAARHGNSEGRAQFVFRPEILDRIDVRAYNTDAYGSKESLATLAIDSTIGRDKTARTRTIEKVDSPTFQSRLKPEEFSQLGGVHELCFEGSVSMRECSELIVPQAAEANSFDDFNWARILRAYADPGYKYGVGVHVTNLANKLKRAWTSPAEAQSALTELGMDAQKAAYYSIGMDKSPRERMIARLKYRGITEVAGKPVELFVRESE